MKEILGKFRTAKLEQRCQLCLRLAEHIWNPNRVKESVAS